MKPVCSGHLRDWSDVSATDRCLLYRGLTKSLLKSQQNVISRTVVISLLFYRVKRLFFIDKNIIVTIFLYINLILILVKKQNRELMLWRQKIKINTFRSLIFLSQYLRLGLHSYLQKKLLEKISDAFCFLDFLLH